MQSDLPLITLTDRQISLNRERLFAWGQGMNVPTPFANRRSAVTRLHIILEAAKKEKQKQIICISDILGSGKTFLINYVLNQVGAMGLEIRFMSKQLGLSLSQANEPPYQSLQIIDEWDIKASSESWTAGLEALQDNYVKWTGTLVLIGDKTLNCAPVREQLGALGPVQYVELETLTRPFFAEALAARVADCFGAKAEPFLDAGLVDALIPNWPITAATFRGSFSVLWQLAQTLIPSERPCVLGKEHLRQWLSSRDTHMNAVARRAADNVVDYVASAGASVRQLSNETLGDLIKVDHRSPEYEKVRMALVGASFVQCLGVPDLQPNGQYSKYPAPYLPGRRASLGAYALA